jgi:hypothetical protein
MARLWPRFFADHMGGTGGLPSISCLVHFNHAVKLEGEDFRRLDPDYLAVTTCGHGISCPSMLQNRLARGLFESSFHSLMIGQNAGDFLGPVITHVPLLEFASKYRAAEGFQPFRVPCRQPRDSLQ